MGKQMKEIVTAEIKSDGNLPTVTPMLMLQTAIDKGASLEQMQQLMDLQERWEKNEARKAFVVAMTAFKAAPPVIRKNKHVSFKTNKGKTEYNHASLDHVANAISDGMAKHGLSFRWDINQDSAITVTCIVTHSLGHSESVSMRANDDQSGGKNSIQAIGSTVTYLQRYTLLAATGLASADSDDDGRGSDPVKMISEAQRLSLVAVLDEHEIDETRWLKHYKINSVADLQEGYFKSAMDLISKRKKKS